MKTLHRSHQSNGRISPVLEQELRKICGLLIAGMAVLLGSTPSHAQAPEYRVKAAMLANFALFVEWPPQAFSGETAPFVACVVGEDPFGQWLKQELGETRVGNHPVEIRRLDTVEQATTCHLVFVSRSEEPRMGQVLARLRSKSALVVSDMQDVSGFCRDGGMIVFVMQGGKVRFELNNDAITRAGLKIDSKLKRVARSAECGA